MPISYIHGDATNPVGPGNKVIAHVCNNLGAWGAGFVLAISKKWSKPEGEYKKLIRSGEFKLGSVQFVVPEPNLIIANMICQNGLRSKSNPHPLDLSALSFSLSAVRSYAEERGASVHMPKIGSGLGGGDWNTISRLISEKFDSFENTLNIYQFG